MAQTVKEVIKIVAPIALDALAKAAAALLAGQPTQSAVAQLPGKRPPAAADDPGSIITTDTWRYCEANFATTYGYYYDAMRSKPTTGDLTIAAGEDIIVWEQHNGIANIQSYLQSVFKDSMNPGDSIELANNLGTLFQQRFGEKSLEWTPFLKRYNYSDGLFVDTYMVTAAAHDVNDNPAGVASYCWVAYNHKSA